MAWHIDSAHSHIYFSVRHMMISKVRGSFESFGGEVSFDPENLTATAVHITVDVNSLATKNADRDGHLASPDFLHAERFPKLVFQSTKIEQIDEQTGKLYGNLTIKDVTKPVVLDVEYAGTAKSPWGTTSAGFSATTSINRVDWGLTWNQALETGGVLVGEKIKIEIELELVQQAETVPA
ncbi:MAG: YceI family protein [Chloroflexota bacterium]